MGEKTKPSTDGSEELKVEEVDNLKDIEEFKLTCHTLSIGFNKKEKAKKDGLLDKVEGNREIEFDRYSVQEEGMTLSLKEGNLKGESETKKTSRKRKTSKKSIEEKNEEEK